MQITFPTLAKCADKFYEFLLEEDKRIGESTEEYNQILRFSDIRRITNNRFILSDRVEIECRENRERLRVGMYIRPLERRQKVIELYSDDNERGELVIYVVDKIEGYIVESREGGNLVQRLEGNPDYSGCMKGHWQLGNKSKRAKSLRGK